MPSWATAADRRDGFQLEHLDALVDLMRDAGEMLPSASELAIGLQGMLDAAIAAVS